MATAKPQPIPRDTHREGPRRHLVRNALLAALLLGLSGLALFWHRLQVQAVLATSYGARIGCTCHYIAGRGLHDCRKDFEPGMAFVMLSDHPETHAITASIPLLASQTVVFRDGPGCQLQGWPQ